MDEIIREINEACKGLPFFRPFSRNAEDDDEVKVIWLKGKHVLPDKFTFITFGVKHPRHGEKNEQRDFDILYSAPTIVCGLFINGYFIAIGQARFAMDYEYYIEAIRGRSGHPNLLGKILDFRLPNAMPEKALDTKVKNWTSIMGHKIKSIKVIPLSRELPEDTGFRTNNAQYIAVDIKLEENLKQEQLRPAIEKRTPKGLKAFVLTGKQLKKIHSWLTFKTQSRPKDPDLNRFCREQITGYLLDKIMLVCPELLDRS